MKILFISDIHGVITSLDKIENIISKKKVDKLIVLGDLYSYNEDDNNIIKKFLIKHSDILICMRGNCDRFNDDSFEIIDDISMISVDNIDIYITHGNRYNYYSNDIFTNGIMVYGHEHTPYIKEDDDMIYICVGSISLPRNNNPKTYMLYEDRVFTIYSLENKSIDSVTV